jgi:hypothetical protein
MTFIDNFMNEYENSDEYDITIIFDDYFDKYIQNNTTEENESLIKMFCTEEEIENMKNPEHKDYCICTEDNSLLYEYLYLLVENAIIESENIEEDRDSM